jgi:uncharacterized protein
MVSLGSSREPMFTALPPGHPIRVMVEEHEVILAMLSDLEQIVRDVDARGHTLSAPELDVVRVLANGLLAAEPHHEREERALFPQMEAVGMDGAPQVMCLEHEELRDGKRQLVALVHSAEDLSSAVWNQRFCAQARALTAGLRTHIAAEDDVVYPMALQEIPARAWREIEAACDRIGPCKFPAARSRAR